MNVLFWVAVKSENGVISKNHGDFEYFEYSKRTWQYWCERNGVLFYEYNHTEYDTTKHKVTWTRWFDVFDQLDTAGIDYEKIAVIDASTMIRWDAPNFFELTNNELTAFQSLENVRWIMEGVDAYSELFPMHEFDYTKYITCGFQIFTKQHKIFLEKLCQFYLDNYEKILILESTVKRGTDQPVYNYMLQIENVNINRDLPKPYWITHLHRFGWLGSNWQLAEDLTPYFIKYGYIWVYSGFDRKLREKLMSHTWDIIKEHYE